MYFSSAVMIISEIGAHGDHELSGADFNHDDRSKRIRGAAESLCDFVYEYLVDSGYVGDFAKNNIKFEQEHLPIIAGMIAVGMMAQFEHDLKMELEIVREQELARQL